MDGQNFFDGNGSFFGVAHKNGSSLLCGKNQSGNRCSRKHVKKIYWLGLPLCVLNVLNQEINL